MKNTLSNVAAGDNVFADVLTTGAVSIPVSGSAFVVASINSETTTGDPQTAEWKLQQRYGASGDWVDIGNTISRSITNNLDFGIASLGLVSTGLARGDYYYRLQCKGPAGNSIVSDNTTLVAVALAYDDAVNGGRSFTAFSKSKASDQTFESTFTDAESEEGDPQVSTNMFFYAQYNMSASAALDAPSFDMALSSGGSVLYSSEDQRRTLASDTDIGSGASVGLATGLSSGTTYSSSLRHKSDGSVTLTTSNIILSGFVTTDRAAEGYWMGGTTNFLRTWNKEGNWADGIIPLSTTNVSLYDKDNNPVISASANCKNLSIGSGSLTIAQGGDLTVAEEIVNNAGNGGIIIQSTTDGDGSLIFTTGTPAATVQRYLVDNSWHLVTPTTTGVTANNFYWSDNPMSWLMYHTESTNLWAYNTDLGTPMPVGKGWSIWVDNDTKSNEIATMTGDLQTENLSPTITYSDGDHSYNLVGNPYTSAIDLGDGTGWTFTNVDETIYVWDNSSDNYLNRTTAGGGSMVNGIIPIGQGFFVHANASSPILTIPTSARTHNNQAFYKDTEQTNNYEAYITIKATQEQKADEVWIGFGDNGSTAFESGWDATKLFGGAESPQLYLQEETISLSVDYLYTLDEDEIIVNMSFIAGIDGQQTITANSENLPNTDVILEDLQTGNTQDLIENPIYIFEGSKEDNSNRFLLHFTWSPDGVDEESIQTSNMNIYYYENEIYIRSTNDAINQPGNIYVYDLLGREVLHQAINGNELVKIPIYYLNSGYAIVKVVKEGSIKAEKILIK